MTAPTQGAAESADEVKSTVGARMLARNTVMNVIGQIVPLLVNIAAVPYVIGGLGTDQFGMLSLAWMIVGYFALFDLGIGPATAKFVAERLARRETAALSPLVKTALLSQLALGTVAAAALLAATPTLVHDVLDIPVYGRRDAYWVFVTLAVSMPISFATGSVAGVLSASQRFDLLNLINIPASCLTYLLPALAISLGYGLVTCVALIVVARCVTFAATFACCLFVHASLRAKASFDWKTARKLIGFGGWMALSGSVAPVLMYFDRFLLGALVSVAAVGFFTPPHMIATKLGILHGGLMMTLFPALCAAHGRNDQAWISATFVRSMKLLVIVVGPAALALSVFANHVLTLWVGREFAEEGTRVLQLLALGVFFNAVTHVPVAVLQAVSRADLTAKLQLLQVPFHLTMVSILTWRFGLIGAVTAWTVRMILECVLYVCVATRLQHMSFRRLLGGGDHLLRSFAAVALLAIGAFALSALINNLAALTATLVLGEVGFALAAWRLLFDDVERAHVKAMLRFF